MSLEQKNSAAQLRPCIPAIQFLTKFEGQLPATFHATRRLLRGWLRNTGTKFQIRIKPMAQNVSDFIWHRLSEWGLKRVYGYPGDGVGSLDVALEKAKDVME